MVTRSKYGPRKEAFSRWSSFFSTVTSSVLEFILYTASDKSTLKRIELDVTVMFSGSAEGLFEAGFLIGIQRAPLFVDDWVAVGFGTDLDNLRPVSELMRLHSQAGFVITTSGATMRFIERITRVIKKMRKLKKGDRIVLQAVGDGDNEIKYGFNVNCVILEA